MYNYLEERNKALFRNYWQAKINLGKGASYLSCSFITKVALRQEAPSYYVSPTRALEVIKEMERRDGENSIKNVASKAMYKSIYRKYKRIISNLPSQSFNRLAVIEDIVTAPAPCIFLDKETATSIIKKTFY